MIRKVKTSRNFAQRMINIHLNREMVFIYKKAIPPNWSLVHNGKRMGYVTYIEWNPFGGHIQLTKL